MLICFYFKLKAKGWPEFLTLYFLNQQISELGHFCVTAVKFVAPSLLGQVLSFNFVTKIQSLNLFCFQIMVSWL